MNIILKLRTQKRMTQRQFAKFLGLKTGQTVSDIETSKVEVRDKHLPVISKKLGRDVASKILKQKVRNYRMRLEAII